MRALLQSGPSESFLKTDLKTLYYNVSEPSTLPSTQ